MFRKSTTLYSPKTKEQTIALLAENVEPWHKDSSTLLFEGKVMPDGEFDFRLSPLTSGYWTTFSSVKIKGCILESVDGNSAIEMHFSVIRPIKITLYLAPILLSIITLLLFLQVLPLRIPWFLPILFLPFFLLLHYLSFLADVRKAEKALVFLLA